jgi:hypothetical protein
VRSDFADLHTNSGTSSGPTVLRRVSGTPAEDDHGLSAGGRPRTPSRGGPVFRANIYRDRPPGRHGAAAGIADNVHDWPAGQPGGGADEVALALRCLRAEAAVRLGDAASIVALTPSMTASGRVDTAVSAPGRGGWPRPADRRAHPGRARHLHPRLGPRRRRPEGQTRRMVRGTRPVTWSTDHRRGGRTTFGDGEQPSRLRFSTNRRKRHLADLPKQEPQSHSAHARKRRAIASEEPRLAYVV